MENWSLEIVFGNGKQKQKQTEEEFSRKITELHTELCESNELRQKLERKVYYCYYYFEEVWWWFQEYGVLINWRENFVVQVSCLVTENDLLENKHRELKETITNLLQSKEEFVKIYEVFVEFCTPYCICYCFLAVGCLDERLFFFATFSCTLFCALSVLILWLSMLHNWFLGIIFCCYCRILLVAWSKWLKPKIERLKFFLKRLNLIHSWFMQLKRRLIWSRRFLIIQNALWKKERT